MALLFLAIVLVGFSLSPLLSVPDAETRRLTGESDGAVLRFETRPGVVLSPFNCYDLAWRIENVRTVRYAGNTLDNAGLMNACGPASFQVVFQDDTSRSFTVAPYMIFENPASVLVGFALAGVLIWQSLFLLGAAPSPANTGRAAFDALFVYAPPTRAGQLLTLVVLAVLAGLGLQHWYAFYEGGNFELDIQDWMMTRRYWEGWLVAGQAGELPFFTVEGVAHTERFIGDPDPGWNPLLVFAPSLSPAGFALLSTSALYLVGCVGLLLLRRRYRLSLLTFTVLFLLFNFNGFITSHLAIGHFTWLGYFFMPFMLLCVLELAERDTATAAARAGLKAAVVLAAMAVFGAFHFIIWWVVLLVVLAASNRTARAGALLAVAGGFLLSAYRYLPVAFAMSDYELGFRTGFYSLQQLLEGLTVVRPFDYLRGLPDTWHLGVYHDLNWWEFDMYISVIGALFVGIWGVLGRFWRLPAFDGLRYRSLDLPLIMMTLFSFGTLYSIIGLIPLPLLNTERVTTRFFIVPLLLLVLIACIRFDRIMPLLLRTGPARALALGSVWLLGFSLGTHSYVWRIAEVIGRWGNNQPYTPLTTDAVIPLSERTMTLTDQLYVLSFPVGIIVTMVTALGWVVLYRRFGAAKTRTPLADAPQV